MNNLEPQQLLDNWDIFLGYIDTYIEEPRKSQLLDFYKQYEERFIMMPASHKPQYHNCFPGGYVDHVNRVVKIALELDKVWMVNGEAHILADYTKEELVFSALNHDLGKFGSFEHEAALPNPSTWHVENRGEIYVFNTELDYMTVPDRGLWILSNLGIPVSKNEFLTIKLHDGLYDESNKPYLLSWAPETKLRTSLPHVVHQADFMAARIEFLNEWSDKLSKPVNSVTKVKPKVAVAPKTKVSPPPPPPPPSLKYQKEGEEPKPPSVSKSSLPNNSHLTNLMNDFFN